MMISLDLDTIHKLLNENLEVDAVHSPVHNNAPEQYGPLRWYDTQMRCACRGCSSPTYCKVNGIPRCMMHALRQLNDIVVGVQAFDEEAGTSLIGEL